MIELPELIHQIELEEKSQNWKEVASLCRVGIRETIDPASPDWYGFRLGLVLSLDKIATAEANEEMISLCEDILANSRLHERARKLPTVNSVLAHAYARSESGPPGENLRRTILHYRAAYESINREDEPVLHASFAVDMGLQYVRLGQDFDIPASELDAAIALVRNAADTLSQRTREDLQVEAECVLRRLTALRAGWGAIPSGVGRTSHGQDARGARRGGCGNCSLYDRDSSGCGTRRGLFQEG